MFSRPGAEFLFRSRNIKVNSDLCEAEFTGDLFEDTARRKR